MSAHSIEEIYAYAAMLREELENLPSPDDQAAQIMSLVANEEDLDFAYCEIDVCYRNAELDKMRIENEVADLFTTNYFSLSDLVDLDEIQWAKINDMREIAGRLSGGFVKSTEENSRNGKKGGSAKFWKGFEKFEKFVTENEFPIADYEKSSHVQFATALFRFKIHGVESRYNLNPKTAAKYRDIFLDTIDLRGMSK